MPERHYSSTAQPMTLSNGITAAATTISVNTVVGLPPSTPFTLVIDRGEATEEIVTVTAVAGTTLTVVRGEDGTTAQIHGMGASVRHMMTARDLRDPQQHIYQSAGVHGLPEGATLMGSSTPATLTNKTMSGADNTFTNIPIAGVSGLSSNLSDLSAAIDTVDSRVTTEVTNRGAAISNEATARANADAALDTRLDTIEAQPTQWRAASTARPTGTKVKDSDLLYETDTQILRIREAGQWRHIGGTPGFFAQRLTGKSIPHAVFTTVDALDEVYDDLNAFNALQGLFIAPVAGVWDFTVSAQIGAQAIATSIAAQLANAMPPLAGDRLSLATMDQRAVDPGSANNHTVAFHAQAKLAKGDPVRFQVWQVNGSSAGQAFTNFAFSGSLRRADPVTF